MTMWKGVPPFYDEQFKRAVRENKSTLLQFVLIIFGAGVNFSVGFNLILGSLTALVTSQGGILFQSSPVPPQVSILAGAYFLIGTLYSVITSLVQRPKLIVSPLYIQGVTATLVPFFVLYSIYKYNPQTDLVLAASEATVFFFTSLVLFGLAGLGQLFLVRYLVGLNGSKTDTRWTTLILEAKLADVKKVLYTREVTNAFRIGLQRDEKDKSMTLRADYVVPEQFYLLIMKDPQDENKTQLATVAYRRGFYGIVPSEAEVLDEMRAEELKRILHKGGIKFSDGEAREALMKVYNQVMELTQAKLLTFRSLEPHVKFITAGIASMFLVMTGLWQFGIIKFDLYETFLLFAGLSLLFEFLPLFAKRATADVG